MRPNLEDEKDPGPSLLALWLNSPPGKGGEKKVGCQCTDQDEEATPVVKEKDADEGGVKVEVDTGHGDVEYEQAQSWGENVSLMVTFIF